MEKTYWYYIEPSSFLSIKKINILLYNTQSGDHIELKSQKIADLLNNEYVQIDENLLSDPEISSFILESDEKDLGGLIDTSYSKSAPVKLRPSTDNYLYKKFAGLTKDQVDKKVLIETYLSQANIYLTNNGDFANASSFNEYSKQFLFSRQDSSGDLPFELLKGLVDVSAGLTHINFLGGNVFSYSKIDLLIELLKNRKTVCVFYNHYTQFSEYYDIIEKILSIENFYIKLLVDLPLNEAALENTLSLFKSFHHPSIDFVIQSEEDYEAVEYAAEKLSLPYYYLKTFYNGSNLDFFKENIFISKDEILESKPSVRELLMKEQINKDGFGVINILTNGDVYSNLSNKKIGSFANDTLFDILYNEISTVNTWFWTRERLSPCHSCLYERICPSPSSYELILGRGNVCLIETEISN